MTFAPQPVDDALAARLLGLALSAGASQGQADVFVERSLRRVDGLTLTRDGEREHVPVLRDDRGAALRAISAETSRLVHVAGEADERLAREWRGERVEGGRGAGDSPPDASPALLARLADAARGAVAREPRLVAVDIELTRAIRATRVVSSRWGASATERDWLVASVVARVASEDGASRARSLRSRGGATLEGLDARALVDEVASAALVRLDARPAPGGRPLVIVAGGAAGVLLHEAVGHALEADVVARGSSFLASRLGEQVATESLTVLDDPSLAGLAGSYPCDDEGAPARGVTLLDRGRLTGLMTDALRSGFDAARATGHGRRQGFRDNVLPRMTNTLVLAGERDPAELLATTPDGLLVTRLERASADPLRGRFQVRATEGFLVEGGRVTAPLAETLLVGTSDDLLRGLDIGSDVAWDDGAGSCGREAQWVSVAIGNPTLRAGAGVFGVA